MTNVAQAVLVERANQLWEVRLGFECVARQLEQNVVVDEVARGLIHTAIRMADDACAVVANAVAERRAS